MSVIEKMDLNLYPRGFIYIHSILPVYKPSCFPFDLVIHSRVSGVQDISLHILLLNFLLWIYFIFYTKATIVWHVLFTSPSLLWKCYKISRNSCTNDSRATLSIIVVIFFPVVHIYVRRAYIPTVYLLYIHRFYT